MKNDEENNLNTEIQGNSLIIKSAAEIDEIAKQILEKYDSVFKKLAKS